MIEVNAHMHKYDVVVEWKYLISQYDHSSAESWALKGKKAVQVMCSYCLEIKELI